MKISDVTLTLFAWEDIPATIYGRHTGKFGGQSQLGLLTLRTDEGAEGHGEQHPSLYPEYPYNGNKWGMVIDTQACIGCHACVIACRARSIAACCSSLYEKSISVPSGDGV